MYETRWLFFFYITIELWAGCSGCLLFSNRIGRGDWGVDWNVVLELAIWNRLGGWGGVGYGWTRRSNQRRRRSIIRLRRRTPVFFVWFCSFSFLFFFFFFLVVVFRHRDAADVGGFRRSFVSRESDRWRCESNGLMPSSHTHTHTHTHKHTDGLVNNSLTEIKITRCRPEMDGSDRRWRWPKWRGSLMKGLQ